MDGAFNINNNVSGRLNSVEICLVIVKDCVQNFNSLKKYFKWRIDKIGLTLSQPSGKVYRK